MQRRYENIPIDPSLLPSTPASQLSRPSSGSFSVNSTIPPIRRPASPLNRSISEWGSVSEDGESLRRQVQQLQATVEHQERKFAYFEQKIEHQTEVLELQTNLLKRLLKDTGINALGLELRAKKQKSQSAEAAPAFANVNILPEDKKEVRRELMGFVVNKIRSLAAVPENGHLPPRSLTPGEHRNDEGNVILIPDFERPTSDKINDRLISQATHLVFKEQTDEATCELSHKNVFFTEKDVKELAKDAFRNWKKKCREELDEMIAAKTAVDKKKRARNQRRHQKARNRRKQKEAYLLQYGADPTPVIDTDWMSDYLSDLDEDEESDRNRTSRQMRIAIAAGSVNHEDIWERVRPAFRSEEINDIYQRLDDLLEEEDAKTGKRKLATKRVDIGQIHNRIPIVAPYPFMVDTEWKAKFVDGKNLDPPFRTRQEDPVGFGSKKGSIGDEFDTLNETNISI